MTTPNVSQLLTAWAQGDQTALDELIPLVYGELQRLSRHYLRGERHARTLETSALINEAFLRLIGQPFDWQNRAHFFGVAAQMMRRVLVDHARVQGRAKRGGEQQRLSLDAVAGLAVPTDKDLLALDDALTQLATLDPRQCRIIELRFFGGLTIAETAEVLGLSHATVEREWSMARAWLRVELGG